MHYATSCRANGSCQCLFQWCTILLLTFSAFSNAAIHPRDTDYISAAWYTGWHSGDFPLSNVSWSKYTHMTYAFATTTPDSSVLNLGTSDKELLPHFVAQAHQHGVNASLAIGGWTGSRWFSSHVGSPENRTRFVTAVSNLIKTYELDGIDFDWEFPGDPGIGCNVVATNDTENYLEFLREFRRSPEGSKTILSLAVFIKPYNDSSRGTADLSEFNKVIDYVEIMNYDIKSSTLVGAGSSSPLDDSCAPEGARLGSAVSAVQAWMDAGITPEKIVLGVPSYGHSFAVSPDDAYQDESTHMVATYPSYNSSLKPSGDRWDGGWGLDVCGNEQGPGGIYTYWGLIDKGLLNKNGTIRGGTSYRFDRCSQTPFAYNLELQTLVSFENAMSFSIKGAYIRESGLKGFAMWEAGGDYHDVLLDAIQNGLRNTSIVATTSGASVSIPTRVSSGVKKRWGELRGILVGLGVAYAGVVCLV